MNRDAHVTVTYSSVDGLSTRVAARCERAGWRLEVEVSDDSKLPVRSFMLPAEAIVGFDGHSMEPVVILGGLFRRPRIQTLLSAAQAFGHSFEEAGQDG